MASVNAGTLSAFAFSVGFFSCIAALSLLDISCCRSFQVVCRRVCHERVRTGLLSRILVFLLLYYVILQCHTRLNPVTLCGTGLSPRCSKTSGMTCKDTKPCIGASMKQSRKVLKLARKETSIMRKWRKGSCISSLGLNYFVTMCRWWAHMTCACSFLRCQTVSKGTGYGPEPSLSTPSKKLIGSLTFHNMNT